MLSESAAEYVRTAPWLVIFPGVAISLAVFGTNLLGDALRDMQAARAANMVALGASFGYIGAEDEVRVWPVTAWIDEPLELLAWVGLSRAAPLLAPHAGA